MSADPAPPLVTVVIPCYNAAASVADTIRSVRAQTYPNIEIIAVNDGSRDDTLELLHALAGPDLKVIDQANAGAAAARNAAIAAARGPVLAFVDADDTWHPEKLARQVALLEANPAMVMVGCRAEAILLGGERLKVNPTRQPPQGPRAWLTLLHHSFYVPSVIIARTDVARAIGGFAVHMRGAEEDQDFFIRMALQGEVGFVDADLTMMHQQPGSLSLHNVSREHQTVLPMILGHCQALAGRLTPAERRWIMGARYTQIGRNVYLGAPAVGLPLLLKAIAHGDEPLANIGYLLTAAPWTRRLKACLNLHPRTAG